MTTKIKLSETSLSILTFDDDVLECFFVDGSTRLHVTHIKGGINAWARDVDPRLPTY